MQIWNFMTARWPNIKILKIQDGGWPPFKKIFFSTITRSPADCPISVKFCIGTQIARRQRSDDKNSKLRKFKMADGRYIEHRFWPYTLQPITRFQWKFAWGSSFSWNCGNGTDTRLSRNVFLCFPNAVWASASVGFRIVSDTLVIIIIIINSRLQAWNLW